ncbi:MAG: hypothetical protein ACKO0Z_20900 [Betaproteobacteria bacterium]
MALTEKQLVALAVSGNNQQLESRDMNIFAKRSVLLTEYAGGWIDEHIFALGWAWTTRWNDPADDGAEYYPLRCVEEHFCFQRVELHPVDAYAFQDVERNHYNTEVFFFTNADLEMLPAGEPIRAEHYKVFVSFGHWTAAASVHVEKVVSVETIIHDGETAGIVRTEIDSTMLTELGNVQQHIKERLIALTETLIAD